MAEVVVDSVTRSFGALKAVDNVSLTFENGRLYALLGPSGSGKTTLLRLIAGFDFPDSGHIRIDGEPVERIPVEKRDVGMMFQSYALFPNMSVAENIAFGLDVRKVPGPEIRDRVAEALALVQLQGLGDRRPHQLSGGQRQRVALARATVIRPRVLLLDEPLSALDKALRVEMQVELKRIQREVGITTIFVTHDQEEALSLADRIGVLRNGRLVEDGPPREIYDHPRSVFAATFLGDANIVKGAVDGDGVRLGGGILLRTETPPHADGLVAIRPEKMTLSARGTGLNMLPGTVETHIFSGASVTTHVSVMGETLKVFARNDGSPLPEPGTAVEIAFSPRYTIPVVP